MLNSPLFYLLSNSLFYHIFSLIANGMVTGISYTGFFLNDFITCFYKIILSNNISLMHCCIYTSTYNCIPDLSACKVIFFCQCPGIHV